ncbi:hypothetical protein KR093_007292 [Drosophila rubida]|uniref:Uncharacterized protein n=1 Tax=Drosophila rubida TaxID=30044 RepID=A0AAD4KC27_9MUSC|nr:hypothetical protein KR093_007292 [Drosophila rubida]
MLPPYERCGEIVWQRKRQVLSFAFKCIYCEHQSSAFRNFKQHLESEHAELMEKVPLIRRTKHKQPAAAVLEAGVNVAAADKESQNDAYDRSDDCTEASESEPESEQLLDLSSNSDTDEDAVSQQVDTVVSAGVWTD